MPSPIGHGLLGIAVARGFRGSAPATMNRGRTLAATLAAANLPDVDTLIYFAAGRTAETGWLAHRGPLHSLGASLAFGALVYLSLRVAGSPSARWWAGLLGVAYASHVILDYFNADFGAPRGVPLLWPISAAYYISPVTVFSNIDWRAMSSWISWHHAQALIRELVLLVPLLYLRLARSTPSMKTSRPGKAQLPQTPGG